jgi:hypothetical protein
MGRIADVEEVILELGLSSTIIDEERAIANVMLGRAEGAVISFLRYNPIYLERTEYLPAYKNGIVSDDRQDIWEVEGSVAVLSSLTTGSSEQLQLSHLPLRSITSLYIDYDGRSGSRIGAFAADTLKVEGTDFWPNYDLLDSGGLKVCSDGVLRSMGIWPSTPGTVKVTYFAGYKNAELHGQDTIIDASPILESVINETVRRVRRFFATKKGSAGFTTGTIVSESLGDYNYSVDGASAAQLLSSGDLTGDSKEKLSAFRKIDFGL